MLDPSAGFDRNDITIGVHTVGKHNPANLAFMGQRQTLDFDALWIWHVHRSDRGPDSDRVIWRDDCDGAVAEFRAR